MKDLSIYIKESILNEGNETFVSFTLFDCDNLKTAIKEISSAAQHSGIYFEETTHGFKLKVKPGQNVDEIVNELEQLIDNIPEDKREELQSKIDSLTASIAKLKDATDDSGE